jgi:phage nucleotide-binding protein
MSTDLEVLSPRHLGGLKILKAHERPPYMNILFYGDPGVGKTRLAGTADSVPEMRKVLFVDLEGGTLTLTHTNPNVDIVRVKNWVEMQAVYDSLLAGNHDYSTVVLDSLTEIQKFNMYNIMKDLIEFDSDRDPDVPGMREWGKNLEQMRKFVRGFRDLPMHTVFTALMKNDKDKKTGLSQRKPSLSGKLADDIAGFLDIVCYMYIKEVDGEQTRLLLTSATDEIVAKDRTGKLPVVMVNPDMTDLLDLISAQPAPEAAVTVG